MDNHWYSMLAKLIEAKIFPQIAHRILIWGPYPGTGKSSWGHYQFGAEKVERIVMHQEVLPDDLLYSVDLKADENGGTSTIRNDGPILRAMRQGKILVIDELDKLSPAMQSTMHAVTDDRSIAGITLPDGTRVTPAEGFGVIATSNQLPTALGGPLLDRFDIVLQATMPHPGAIEGLKNQGVKAAVINKYSRIAKAEWRADLSMRRAMSFDKIRGLVDAEFAAKCVFGDGWQDELNNIVTAGASK